MPDAGAPPAPQRRRRGRVFAPGGATSVRPTDRAVPRQGCGAIPHFFTALFSGFLTTRQPWLRTRSPDREDFFRSRRWRAAISHEAQRGQSAARGHGATGGSRRRDGGAGLDRIAASRGLNSASMRTGHTPARRAAAAGGLFLHLNMQTASGRPPRRLPLQHGDSRTLSMASISIRALNEAATCPGSSTA